MVRDTHLDSVTCILDGLDECIEESLSTFLVKIRSLLAPGIPKSSNQSHVRLKVSHQ